MTLASRVLLLMSSHLDAIGGRSGSTQLRHKPIDAPKRTIENAGSEAETDAGRSKNGKSKKNHFQGFIIGDAIAGLGAMRIAVEALINIGSFQQVITIVLNELKNGISVFVLITVLRNLFIQTDAVLDNDAAGVLTTLIVSLLLQCSEQFVILP